MKKKIFGILFPFLLSILCGYLCGKFLFKAYFNDINNDLKSSKIYLIQNGSYDSYDVMRQENTLQNYVYYQDGNNYKTVVGITKDYGNISKIKKLYNDNLIVSEYYVPIGIISSKQDYYDSLLSQTNDIDDVKLLVDDIINLYHDSDNIRLVAFN